MDDVPQRQSRITNTSTRASDLLSSAAEENEAKPIRCAKFRQQELWAWKPVWSPKVVVIMYFVVSVIFIPIGAVIFAKSNSMVNTPRFRYDNFNDCNIGPGLPVANLTEGDCTIRIQLEKNVTAPFYLYYGIVNYYQNARTYVDSRSFSQLRGEEVAESKLEDSCDPLFKFDNGTVIYPCGLVAGSFFNDSFELCRDTDCTQKVELNKTDISWNIDREKRFLPREVATEAERELITDEDFMNWMRVGTYRNWKKLYRRIETDLENGTYYVKATSRYPVESFGGQKFFFISETTWFGGPNEVLGISYMAVGGVTLVLAITFLVQSHSTKGLDLPAETTVPLDGIMTGLKNDTTGEGGDDDRPNEGTFA